MEAITLIDTFGDRVVIEPSIRDKGGVSLSIYEGSERGEALFDADGARSLIGAVQAVTGVGAGSTAINVATTPEELDRTAGETVHPTAAAAWNDTALNVAIQHGRKVTLSYQKEKGPGGVIERRVLAPEERLVNRQGQVLYVGNDIEREDVRAFRLDRIVGTVEVA